eukprot:s114_g47.t1
MVADVLGGALPNGQEAKERIPSPYGLAVDDSAARTGADGWVVPIRAWIYRRNEQRHRIRMALARKIMMEMIHGIKNISKEGVRRYEERGRLIFRTLAFRGGERNVVLSVKFDGEDEWRDLPPTNGNGRVEVDVTVPEHLVESMASETGLLNFTVRLPAKSPGEEVTARGSSLLVQPEGVMEGKGRERKGKEGKGRERKGKEGKGTGKEGKGRERKAKEREGKGKEGRKGKEGKGREREWVEMGSEKEPLGLSELGCADGCGRRGWKGVGGNGWGKGAAGHERAWMRGRLRTAWVQGSGWTWVGKRSRWG